MEATWEDRLAVASSLILQSPPGEVNDVFNDVRPIVGDDNEIEQGLLPALTQYNTEQLTLVELPNSKIPAMICSASRLDPSSGENRYLDPHSKQTFVFDHLRLTATDVIPFTPADQEEEELRAELNREAEQYVKNHFHNAVWSVFSTSNLNNQNLKAKSSPESDDRITGTIETDPSNQNQAIESNVNVQESNELNPNEHDHVEGSESVSQSTSDQINPTAQTDENHNSTQSANAPTEPSSTLSNKFELYIVGNKYNPTNYWTGRWRSIYEIDLNTNQIKGQIYVNVHYYEQGNVQLTTNHSPIIELESRNDSTKKSLIASQIIKTIEETESKYQISLNSAYTELGDTTFKQLRRALPVTKQKVNWSNMKTRIVLNEN